MKTASATEDLLYGPGIDGSE